MLYQSEIQKEKKKVRNLQLLYKDNWNLGPVAVMMVMDFDS